MEKKIMMFLCNIVNSVLGINMSLFQHWLNSWKCRHNEHEWRDGLNIADETNVYTYRKCVLCGKKDVVKKYFTEAYDNIFFNFENYINQKIKLND